MKIEQRKEIQNERFRRVARLKKQKGELSLIESGAVLGAGALVALVVYMAVPFVRNMVAAHQFKSEASMFHTGIQNATLNDADFSAESLSTLAKNHAFDAAGARMASDYSSVTGMFGGSVTASVGKVTNANDAMVVSYPVPAAVCSMATSALVNTFPQVVVNSTTIFSPTTTYSSSAAGTACTSSGAVATIQLYTTRS
ncbi:hypothetical protein P5W99_35950 [Paraburkholderia sp. A3BS-1L]|uniref:hypothetical protein n=1 Tax=Paraburkholderia sp. A3BS-1L TaxID=3028375 RepID=UPI003DA89C5A